jgi:preprotein translocase subunit SecF
MEKENLRAAAQLGAEAAFEDAKGSSVSEQLFLAGMLAVVAAIMVLPLVIAYFS